MQATEAATPPPATEPDRQALIEFLRDRDISCPLCRYNLRGLLSPRCPECGRDLELRVGLSEPRLGAWLTAQIAVTAAAGIGVMIAIVVCSEGWPRGDPHQKVLNFAFAQHLLMIPIAGALILLRRRYMRLALSVQWMIAALALAAVVAGIIMLAIASI